MATAEGASPPQPVWANDRITRRVDHRDIIVEGISNICKRQSKN